jgi:hypothetical protein
MKRKSCVGQQNNATRDPYLFSTRNVYRKEFQDFPDTSKYSTGPSLVFPLPIQNSFYLMRIEVLNFN